MTADAAHNLLVLCPKRLNHIPRSIPRPRLPVYARHLAATFMLGLMPLAGGCHKSPRWSESTADVPIVMNPGRTGLGVDFTLSPAVIRRFDLSRAGLEWRSGISGDPLGDGGFAVTDGTKFAFFTDDGKLRTTLGREGSGPDEFRNVVASCVTAGDTLIAQDMSLGIFAVIDTKSPAVVRTFPDTIGRMLGNWCFADGTFITAKVGYDRRTRNQRIRYRRYRTSGNLASDLKEFDLPRHKFEQTGSPRIATRKSDWIFVDLYYSEALIYDTTGALVQIIRTKDPVAEIPWEEAYRTRGIEVAAGTASPRRTSSGGSRKPFWGSVMSDSKGRIWLRDPTNIDIKSEFWTLFNSHGTLLGRFELPLNVLEQDISLLAVMADEALIRRSAEDGTPDVELHPIEPLAGRLTPSPVQLGPH